ncbi:hypothetical protein, partial [uncultured Dubosiella sp.]|uniref:hypothetical protein n=1 Tax=uncultured Dubosiella sp. TaxID=1937011 RepID=UPI0025DE682A
SIAQLISKVKNMVYIKQILLCQADVVLLLRSSKDYLSLSFYAPADYRLRKKRETERFYLSDCICLF